MYITLKYVTMSLKSLRVYTFDVLIIYLGILVAYGLIGRLAWKAKRPIHTQPMSNETRAQWKITQMMGQIILLYVVCYIPLFIIDRMLLADPTNITYMRSYHVATVVYSLTTCINPILYGWKDASFRRAYRKILPRYLTGFFFRTVEDSSLLSVSVVPVTTQS